LAERSKAVAQGAIPKGRGFEPHRCRLNFFQNCSPLLRARRPHLPSTHCRASRKKSCHLSSCDRDPVRPRRPGSCATFWVVQLARESCKKSLPIEPVRPGSGGWLAGWLVDWLAGWLAGWLTGWLAGWLSGWLRSNKLAQAGSSKALQAQNEAGEVRTLNFLIWSPARCRCATAPTEI
jgi:hypothetical protein